MTRAVYEQPFPHHRHATSQLTDRDSPYFGFESHYLRQGTLKLLSFFKLPGSKPPARHPNQSSQLGSPLRLPAPGGSRNSGRAGKRPQPWFLAQGRLILG
jgi:hypothetical protein